MACSTISNIRPFDGSNFENWRYRVERVLERNGVLIMLKKERPIDESKINAFDKDDAKARDIIVQCIDDSVLELIKCKTTAKDMMETLQATYVRKSLTSRIVLQKRLRNMTFDGNSSLNSYIIEFDKVVSELRNVGGSVDNEEYVSQLLASMPDEYQSVITSIDILLTSNPEIVSEDFVKGKLLSEEERMMKSTVKSEVSGNAFYTNRKFQNRNKNAFNNGAKPKQRYENNRNSNNQQRENAVKCWLCKAVGHKRSECRQRNNNRSNAYMASSSSSDYNRDIAFMSDNKAVECQPDVTEQGYDYVFAGNVETENEIIMVIDSGASNHLIKADFGDFCKNVKKVSHSISVAKEGETVKATTAGDLSLITENNVPITLCDVLVCDKLFYNLLSVRKMVEAGMKVEFQEKVVNVWKNGEIILQGKRAGNLFILKLQIRQTYEANLTKNSDDLWHRRMGHSFKFPVNSVCEVCLKGKQSNKKSMKCVPEERKPKRLLECVSSDVCGKISPPTHDGYEYFVSFIDHFSHFSIIYLMKRKNEVESCLKKYVALTESMFNTRISKLRCDNGGEYVSASIRKFCSEKGIELVYTVPRNPHQNGVAERFNRTVMDKARCMIFDSSFHKQMWGEAVLTATYLINRIPTSVLPDNMTPSERWYGYKDDLKKIHIFGCTAHALIPPEDREGKLSPHSKKLKLVGYCNNGYRLWDEEKCKVVMSRSVTFDESVNFVKCVTGSNLSNEVDDDETEQLSEEELESTFEATRPKIQQLSEGQQNCQPEVRRSRRNRELPAHFNDFEMMMALSAGNIPSEVPQSYEEAIVSEEWKSAIDAELKSMVVNKTWELVEKPPNIKVIDSRWVFTVKNINNCDVKKARLVARGFQQPALGDENFYSPVARMFTLRTILSLAIEYNMKFLQLDVKSAFLSSPLHDAVYMKPPCGLKVPDNKVCKLMKALYGLKQSPKCFNEFLNEKLSDLKFKRSETDPCLYFNEYSYILIWVDDMLVVSRNESDLNYLKENLMKCFDLKISENNNKFVFLGIEIETGRNRIKLSQKTLLQKILKNFQMDNSKIAPIPIQPNLYLKKENNVSDSSMDIKYRELVGSLMYLMLGTRPDICFSVAYFGRFQSCFNSIHYKYLKNVLRYLNGTQELGLVYRKNDEAESKIVAYADSDFASDINDRKSVSGFLIKMNQNILYWCSKKQPMMAISTTEADYIALSMCMCECLF